MSNKRKVRNGSTTKMPAFEYVPPGHRQVEVQHPEQGPIEVDEGIAELVEALWAVGIDTLESCEDVGNGRFILAFPVEASQRFVDVVFGGDNWRPASLQYRGAHPTHGTWAWKAHPHSYGGSPCRMHITVLIPASDLPEVLARVLSGGMTDEDRHASLYEPDPGDGLGPRFEVPYRGDTFVVFEDGTVHVVKSDHVMRCSAPDESRWALEAMALGDHEAAGRTYELLPYVETQVA